MNSVYNKTTHINNFPMISGFFSHHKAHFVYHFMIFGVVHVIVIMNTQILKRHGKRIIIETETTLNNSQNREDK